MKKNICVFCSSSNSIDFSFFEAAEELGEIIAKKNHTLIYGGGRIGLMGRIAKSVHSNSGEVVGVIPKPLRELELAYERADELIITKDMRERKRKIEDRSDAFICLAGGFGSLEEILEIITLKQLKFHNKPVVFVNTNNYFQLLFEFFENMFKEKFAKPTARNLYFVARNPTEAITYIEQYKPIHIPDKLE